MNDDNRLRSTTILAVLADGRLAMGGDGQVSLGQMIVKGGSRKVRPVFDGRVLTGFAGAGADAITLRERFETKLTEYAGNVLRASVELAREWRADKYLRNLEAMMLVGDREHLLTLGGNGEILEPEDGLAAIGSGAGYALAAARALRRHTALAPHLVVEEALRLAAELCVYTNDQLTVEVLE